MPRFDISQDRPSVDQQRALAAAFPQFEKLKTEMSMRQSTWKGSGGGGAASAGQDKAVSSTEEEDNEEDDGDYEDEEKEEQSVRRFVVPSRQQAEDLMEVMQTIMQQGDCHKLRGGKIEVIWKKCLKRVKAHPKHDKFDWMTTDKQLSNFCLGHIGRGHMDVWKAFVESKLSKVRGFAAKDALRPSRGQVAGTFKLASKSSEGKGGQQGKMSVHKSKATSSPHKRSAKNSDAKSRVQSESEAEVVIQDFIDLANTSTDALHATSLVLLKRVNLSESACGVSMTLAEQEEARSSSCISQKMLRRFLSSSGIPEFYCCFARESRS